MNGLVYWCAGSLQDPGHAERFVRVTGKADTTYAVVDHDTVANIVTQGRCHLRPQRGVEHVVKRFTGGKFQSPRTSVAEMAEVVGIRTNHTETAMGIAEGERHGPGEKGR